MPIPSTPRDVDRVSAQQQIYNTLKDWIVDGTLVPGEFINDSEIAKYFSVSRTPVRGAILLLSQQDFVKIMPSKGTKVTETSEEAAAFIYEAISCLSQTGKVFKCDLCRDRRAQGEEPACVAGCLTHALRLSNAPEDHKHAGKAVARALKLSRG